MTREEAKVEINKVFEPAFANYIITALTEGATPSERKTGKWIDRTICSNCNWFLRNRWGMAVDSNFLYCPNCGTKMEGAKE